MNGSVCLCLALVALSVSSAQAAKDARGWVIVNEDNDHYFKCEKTNDHWPVAGGDAQMTVPALEAYADMITASGKVTHVFWCTCGQRPNFDSKAWEPIWYPLTQEGADFTVIDAGSRTWPENALLLHKRGIDPYKVWIARCRKNGAQAWVSMRMNDVHHLWREKYFRNTVFCDTHPEMNVSRKKKATWDLASMDYSFQEVRDHHMKMFRELVDRYDADGIEMDFCRSGMYFPKGKGLEQTPVMTAFIREAAAYAKAKRGKNYGIAIRMNPDPKVAREKGFDVATLAKEGSVDVVIPCLQSPSGNGFTIDYDAWKEVLKDAPKTVLVGGTTTTFGGPYHNAASLAGWSAAMRARGWKNLYLFNYAYMDRETRAAGYFKDALYTQPGAAVPQTFLFQSDRNRPLGLDRPQEQTLTLPAGTKARKTVRVVCAYQKGTPLERVTLNGVTATLSATKPHEIGRTGFYDFPASAVRAGVNTLSLKPGESKDLRLLRAAIEVE